MKIQRHTIPLLHDHHTHPQFYAAFGKGLRLTEVTSKAEANQRLTDAASDQKLVVANGWRSNHFAWTESELNDLPPVAIFNVSLHSLAINDAGREQLFKVYGDVIEKLEDRQWYEANLRTVLNWFANLNASESGLIEFYRDLEGQGIYSAEELLLVDEQEIERFQNAGLLQRTKFWVAPDTFKDLSAESKQKIAGQKLFTDGAIGSRTAATSRAYLNQPENNGMLIYSNNELLETIERCLAGCDALAIHAIGDLAIEQVIRSLETIGGPCPNVRLEHVQLISQQQARRAKELGVTLSMQPNFSCDSVDYSDRLDAEYCSLNNPFRMLIDDFGFTPGVDLILGSDGMPHGAEAALNASLFPPLDSQQLTMEEFVAGYCLPNAEKGQVEISIDEDQRRIDVDEVSTQHTRSP